MVAEEVGECSSYATEESEDEIHMEPTATETPGNSPDAMRSIVASIAAMDAVQATIVEKLATIERAIGTVQFDMSWVRDDVRGVHTAMEKLAKNVCEMRGAHIEVERLQEQISAKTRPRTSCIEETSAKEHGMATAASLVHGNQFCNDEHQATQNPLCEEDDGSIQETQLHNNIADTPKNMASTAEDAGGNEWLNDTEFSTGLCSPPCAQTRTCMDVDEIDDETQYLEYNCPGGNTQTPLPSRSLWREFTSVVRDLPAPSAVGVHPAQGWVGAKRGPARSPEHAQHRATTPVRVAPNGAGTFNLNLSPEKHLAPEGGRGRGREGVQNDIGGTSRGGGRSGGRGRGRGRRPPPVQPQYHTAVRTLNTTSLLSSDIAQSCVACHVAHNTHIEYTTQKLAMRG